MAARKTMIAIVLSALALTRGTAGAEDKQAGTSKPVADKPVADKPAAPARAAPEKPSPSEPTRGPESDPSTGELAQIEQELAAVMDELVAARARAGVLARSLFHTELRVDVSRRASAQNLSHVVLRLDGVPVHDSDGGGLGKSRAQLFTGYVTPGRHELAIELVEAAKEDASYGYTRSERYRIEVKKDRKTTVELLIYDDSDMAEEAAEGDEGEYQIETRLRVRSERAPD